MTTQEAVPATADLRKYIETRLFGDRPHIRGRRIPVSMVAENAHQWTIAELAYDFSIIEEEVLAALLYYHEHKDEIDHQEVEDEKLWNERYEASLKKQQE